MVDDDDKSDTTAEEDDTMTSAEAGVADVDADKSASKSECGDTAKTRSACWNRAEIARKTENRDEYCNDWDGASKLIGLPMRVNAKQRE